MGLTSTLGNIEETRIILVGGTECTVKYVYLLMFLISIMTCGCLANGGGMSFLDVRNVPVTANAMNSPLTKPINHSPQVCCLLWFYPHSQTSIQATNITSTTVEFTASAPPVNGAVMVMINSATVSNNNVQYMYTTNPEFYSVIPSNTILG